MKPIVGFLILIIVIPFNYFFENNFNALPYQIPIAFILSNYLFKFKFNHLFLIIFTVIILLISSNISLYDFVFSPVTASFILFWIILLYSDIKIPKYNFDRILLYLIIIIIIFVSYINIDFYQNNNFLEQRSKGFGSGTIFSIVSLVSLTYIYIEYVNKKINGLTFSFLFIVLISTLLLTQSRGALLTLVFVFIYTEFSQIKKIKWFRVILIIVGAYFLITNTTILERFDTNNYNDFEGLTSGRSVTQLYIINSFVNNFDIITLFFGNGLNSVKDNLVTLGLEFPHFDMFFILYEGGLVLLTIYIITIFKLYKRFNNKVYFWIFFISSLHTNIILSPGLLFFCIIFAKYKINTLTSSEIIKNENNTSISD